ncbi:MAG: hypothetical protein AABX90_03670 [Nanoarchaeota archaeon]
MEKISFKDWKKLDLRVGQIKAVKDHPNADKLHILLVDLGLGEHDVQLIAGLKEHYSEAQLIGKKVIVIRNLEPTMIRGIESQGMLLAAVFKNKVVLLQPEKDIETGAKIE